MKKRIIMFLTSLVFFTALTFSGSALMNDKAYAAQTFTLNYPTQQQIRERYKQYAIDLKKVPNIQRIIPSQRLMQWVIFRSMTGKTVLTR